LNVRDGAACWAIAVVTTAVTNAVTSAARESQIFMLRL
jgi:hypothetical protein